MESVVEPAVRHPEAAKAADYWFLLGGVLVMIFLNVMRYRFIWWPFHPIGFALSGTTFSRLTASTILFAWATKYLLLKLAGPAFYRRSKPFFVGILIAYILAVIVGGIVDAALFPGQGHVVHKWY